MVVTGSLFLFQLNEHYHSDDYKLQGIAICIIVISSLLYMSGIIAACGFNANRMNLIKVVCCYFLQSPRENLSFPSLFLVHRSVKHSRVGCAGYWVGCFGLSTSGEKAVMIVWKPLFIPTLQPNPTPPKSWSTLSEVAFGRMHMRNWQPRTPTPYSIMYSPV